MSLTQATFHVVDRLAVTILLGTSFIDQDIFRALPQSEKVVPRSSKSVSSLALKTTDANVIVVVAVAFEGRLTATETQVELHVVKQI